MKTKVIKLNDRKTYFNEVFSYLKSKVGVYTENETYFLFDHAGQRNKVRITLSKPEVHKDMFSLFATFDKVTEKTEKSGKASFRMLNYGKSLILKDCIELAKDFIDTVILNTD